MIHVPPGILGCDFDLGTVDVTPDMIRRYAQDVGDDEIARAPCQVAPLNFALVLRGSAPDVRLDPATFAVHAGHEIEALRPMVAPEPITSVPA